MSYMIDEEELMQIGKELGLEVKFNSKTPGAKNKETGEVVPLQDYFDHFLICEKLLKEYEDAELASKHEEDDSKVEAGSRESYKLDSAEALFKKDGRANKGELL